MEFIVRYIGIIFYNHTYLSYSIIIQNMNRLEALKVFITVAETLHFRESASRLAVSPQVVTRIIGELEQELGEVLFQRSTRQVKLTDFGQQFLPKAQLLLQDADSLFDTASNPIHKQDMVGTVRIAVPQMALMQTVLQALLQVLTPYPNLRIDWRSDLELLDVIDAKIDVGIRFGKPEDSRLIVKKVGVAEDCIVASPKLLEKIGTPKDWQELQRYYPLSALLNPNTGRAWAWYLSSQYQFVPNQPKFMANNMNDELVTVLQGQTIACLPRLMCRDYLTSGELVEIFSEWERKQWSAYVYRPQRNITHPRVKLVFDTLAEILSKHLS